MTYRPDSNTCNWCDAPSKHPEYISGTRACDMHRDMQEAYAADILERVHKYARSLTGDAKCAKPNSPKLADIEGGMVSAVVTHRIVHRYTPSCDLCDWVGIDQPTEQAAIIASEAHIATTNHDSHPIRMLYS